MQPQISISSEGAAQSPCSLWHMLLLGAGFQLPVGSIPPLKYRCLLGRALPGIFCSVCLEVVTIHKWHYLYCAAVQLLGALHLHKPWPIYVWQVLA